MIGRRAFLIGSGLVMAAGAARAEMPRLSPSGGRAAFVFDHGAKGDGIADDTAALQSALATGAPVDLGHGRFRITRGLVLRSGQILSGASSRSSTLVVDGSFDMTAPAVVDLKGPEPGGELRDLAITFAQPDTGDRNALTPYPPAIRAQSLPRFKLTRLRVERAWIGLDMRGNSGGATIDDFELSAFDRGIWIDGSLDSVRIAKLHIWPFGITKAQRPLYDQAEGLRVGRCDDLHLSDGLLFGLRKAAIFHRGEKGVTFGTLTNVNFDTCGGLICENGVLTAVGCTFTIGVTDAEWIRLDDGILTVVGAWFHANKALNGPGISAVRGAGTLSLEACVFSTQALDFVHMDFGPKLSFNLGNITVQKAGGAAQIYQKPFMVVRKGARGVVSGLMAPGVAQGDLIAIEPAADVELMGVRAQGWRTAR